MVLGETFKKIFLGYLVAVGVEKDELAEVEATEFFEDMA